MLRSPPGRHLNINLYSLSEGVSGGYCCGMTNIAIVCPCHIISVSWWVGIYTIRGLTAIQWMFICNFTHTEAALSRSSLPLYPSESVYNWFWVVLAQYKNPDTQLDTCFPLCVFLCCQVWSISNNHNHKINSVLPERFANLRCALCVEKFAHGPSWIRYINVLVQTQQISDLMDFFVGLLN